MAMDRNGWVRWEVSGDKPREGTFFSEPPCQ